MSIEIKFNITLSESEQQMILQNLNLDLDASSLLEEVLGKMAEASFNEYKRMFTGISVSNLCFKLETLFMDFFC